MEELIKKVTEWGVERNINNPDKQTIKTLEELGELAHEISRNRYDTPEVKDAIGDVTVCLIVLCNILGLDFKECLEMAYHEISGRKGQTIDGNFIKDSQ